MFFFKRKKNERRKNVTFGQRSDVGRVRAENEDSCGKFPDASLDLAAPQGLLFVVADGVGGHARGKEASAMAVETLQQIYFTDPSPQIAERLRQAFLRANARIHQNAQTLPDDQMMGTTCTALVLKDNTAHFAHVGDSRIYHLTPERIEQLTHDHTEVAALQRGGMLTEREAKTHPQRSVLNRALGIDSSLEVDVTADIAVQPGECFVLCTDGLAKIEMPEIKKIVRAHAPQEACDKLVELANARGGHDNVTVQVIRINK